MNTQFSIRIIAATLLLSGCSSLQQQAPAPVSEASVPATTQQAVPQVDDGGGVQIRAYQPATPVAQLPVHGKAVISLLAQAKHQQEVGDYPRAVGTLERALRIEPRNAHLWNRLAHLRFDQKRSSMAVDLAAKSTTLAGADVALKRDNWLLIAQARRVTGDLVGAQVAERKARTLY